MSKRNTIIDWMDRFLRKRNLTVAPLQHPGSFEAMLARLQSRKIPFGTLIDVGASNGCWTEAALRYFPGARYLCFEAQSAHEPALRQFIASRPNVEYVIAAAGAKEGEIYFDNTDLFGGIASDKPFAKNCVVVPLSTIDVQVSRRALKPPYLIKLDTHGFELPILEGAAQTLLNTEALIIETYNMVNHAPAVRFYEMCRLLEGRGFRCADIYDLHYRPHDNLFWQMDMVFLRANRPEFQYLGYY